MKTLNPSIAALERAIALVGGNSALAVEIGVAASLPSMWKKRGAVPIANCPAIEKATSGAVRRQDLRPDDWHLIWPELPGAAERTEALKVAA